MKPITRLRAVVKAVCFNGVAFALGHWMGAALDAEPYLRFGLGVCGSLGLLWYVHFEHTAECGGTSDSQKS